MTARPPFSVMPKRTFRPREYDPPGSYLSRQLTFRRPPRLAKVYAAARPLERGLWRADGSIADWLAGDVVVVLAER